MANEVQAVDFRLAIAPLVSLGSRRGRQQADLLVKPDRGDFHTGFAATIHQCRYPNRLFVVSSALEVLSSSRQIEGTDDDRKSDELSIPHWRYGLPRMRLEGRNAVNALPGVTLVGISLGTGLMTRSPRVPDYTSTGWKAAVRGKGYSIEPANDTPAVAPAEQISCTPVALAALAGAKYRIGGMDCVLPAWKNRECRQPAARGRCGQYFPGQWDHDARPQGLYRAGRGGKQVCTLGYQIAPYMPRPAPSPARAPPLAMAKPSKAPGISRRRPS